MDSDVCNGTDRETAFGIDFSFSKLDPLEGNKLKLYSQATDAGGGGTSAGLAREIANYERIPIDNDYIYCTYSLHGHNLTIESPTKKLFGTGGISF